MSLKTKIQKYAMSLGAQLVGITPVEVYREYLAEVETRLQETGAQPENFMLPSGDTSFLARLSDARNALPDAKTIILVGVYAYDEAAGYSNTWQELRGKTARTYNYYPVARQIAERVAAFIEEHEHKALCGQHIPLKFVADRIGLGAYGKNGIFQTAQYGSYIAFRNVLTDVELAPVTFENPSTLCEACERCLKACPTGALYAPYKVNPKLCINPISRREAYIEPHIRSKMENWISGCDICQEVCPANKDLGPREVDPRAGFDPRHHSSHKNLGGLERTPALIPLLEAKWPEIIRRNAAIALANIARGRKEALMALQEQLDSAPLGLKEYFTWALNVLKDKREQT